MIEECFSGIAVVHPLDGVLVLDAEQRAFGFEHVEGHVWIHDDVPGGAIDLAPVLLGTGMREAGRWRLREWEW